MFHQLLCLILYLVTCENQSVSQPSADFRDDTEPFGPSSTSASANFRLPSHVAPYFYRLKLKANLEKSSFRGDVYITIRASKKVHEIILHSKNLSINDNVTLTEEIYENMLTLHPKVKREINDTAIQDLNVTSANFTNIPVTTESTIESTTPSIYTQVPHSNVKNIKIKSMIFSSGDRLILSLGTALTPNVDYILQLSFEGQISNSLTGFYKSSYKESNGDVKQIAVTQFEPISARTAFPCFDEPMFKAKFEISIAHKQNVSVLSNMKVATEELIESEPGWKWTHFERSVDMSTYLVAYVLSDFKKVETSYVSKDNVTKPIRIWTRPSLISHASYALNITPKLLSYYEEVFGAPYPLDKMDLIAIPDFAYGGMENWGLITFAETRLIFDEKEGIPRAKQYVAIDIAHELAHQWFGDLVTMKWWTDLWLNEAFATYIEYIGTNYVNPEWNMLESFTLDKMSVLLSDAHKNTSPVSREVIDASQISQKFDDISYTKGACLIRMLNHTISSRLFHNGLVIYLNEWKYKNAEENDLWHAISKATGEDSSFKNMSMVDFMNSWTRQPGYPVVNVCRNYATGCVTFQQKLFEITKTNRKEELWHIPISYTTLDTPKNIWTASPQFWLNEQALNECLPINNTQALYVNVDAIGYYRVNYDQRNWELLNKAMKSGTVKNPVTKSQLIDDAFNLAKSGQLNYSYALGLTTYVINGQNSKIVWKLLLNNMAFLKQNLQATSGYTYFQNYIKIILKKELERLNYGLSTPKDDNEAFLIENLLTWECLVGSERCLKWARDEFYKWIAKPDINDNPIPSYLRSLVYNMVIKYGGRKEFDFFWNLFQNSKDPNVKSLIISLLPSVSEESLNTFLLEKSITDLPSQYAVSAWNVESPIGTQIAQDFLIQNFDRVYDTFTQIDPFMFKSVLNKAFGFITNNEELDKFQRFALQHKEKLIPMSQTLQKIVDTAEMRINWAKKYVEEINQWFKQYVTDNTTTTTITTTEQSVLTENVTITITPNTTSSP